MHVRHLAPAFTYALQVRRKTVFVTYTVGKFRELNRKEGEASV